MCHITMVRLHNGGRTERSDPPCLQMSARLQWRVYYKFSTCTLTFVQKYNRRTGFIANRILGVRGSKPDFSGPLRFPLFLRISTCLSVTKTIRPATSKKKTKIWSKFRQTSFKNQGSMFKTWPLFLFTSSVFRIIMVSLLLFSLMEGALWLRHL